jgi:hypothetical protein
LAPTKPNLIFFAIVFSPGICIRLKFMVNVFYQSIVVEQ